MSTVLVIGESPAAARALAQRLGLSGVEAIPCAREWRLAVRCLTSNDVGLILLDVDASSESREFFNLMLDLSDKPLVTRGTNLATDQVVWYLDRGATDFVGSKMASEVLTAKIMAHLRGANNGSPAAGPIELGSLTIDLERYTVTRQGKPVSLTPLEFKLLRALAENAGRACSRQMLLDRVWGEDFRSCSHYLRLYIGYLRNKLEDNPRRPKVVLTEWGYGYRLAEPKRQSEKAKAAAPARLATSR